MSRPTIAIVGGGFCGTLCAIHLLRSAAANPPLCIQLIERSGRPGRGVAYGTESAAHCLNVPAGRMSAFEHDPPHFVRWLRRHEPAAESGTFAQRRRYGEYLAALLHESMRGAAAKLEMHADSAVGVELLAGGGSALIELASGRLLRAQRVILALGNLKPIAPPAPLDVLAHHPRCVTDPWAPDALCAVQRDDHVLMLGSGLTMLDTMLELRRTGHRGPLLAVSRRGLLPQAHRAPAKPPPPYQYPPALRGWPGRLCTLLAWVRAEVRRAEEAGDDWRELLNNLRPITNELWQRLDLRGRRQFLRHLRPYWDSHRHRAPAEAAAALEREIRAGTLRVIAGRVCGVAAGSGGIAVDIALRGSPPLREVAEGTARGNVSLCVQRVINCTGPQSDIRNTNDPLLLSLLEQGVARADDLSLGLETSDDGALIDSAGAASRIFYTLGSLRRGQMWESTAVPELRQQAADLVAHLLSSPALCGRCDDPAAPPGMKGGAHSSSVAATA